jgi:hypothetical protein
MSWVGKTLLLFIVGRNVDVWDVVLMQNVVSFVLVTCVEGEREMERKKRTESETKYRNVPSRFA